LILFALVCVICSCTLDGNKRTEIDLSGNSENEQNNGNNTEENFTVNFSEDQAVEIASKHWSIKSGSTSEDGETQYLIIPIGTDDSSYYRIALLSWVLNGARAQSPEEILVSKETGETLTPEECVIDDVEESYALIKTANGWCHYIFNSEKKIVRIANTTTKPTFWEIDNSLLSIRIDVGGGNTQFQLYDPKDDKFSEVFDYGLYAGEGKVVHLGGDIDNRFIVVRNIFDKNVFYREYSLDFAKVDAPVSHASLFGGILYVKYFPEDSELTKEIKIPLVDKNIGYFESYESIIRLWDLVLESIEQYDDHVDYAAVFNVTDETHKSWLNKLIVSSLALRNEAHEDKYHHEFRNSMGYAIKDLNGDGTYELIFIRNDYRVIAIFTTVNGEPVLLGNYWDRKSCFIDENGLIYEAGSNGSDSSSKAVCRIKNNSKELEIIAEFGLDGHEWVDGVAVQIYFKTASGEKIRITKEEYDSLNSNYFGKLGEYTFAQYTSDFSGIYYTSVPTKYYDVVLSIHLDNYMDMIAPAEPMDDEDIAELSDQKLIAMYRALIDSYKISSPDMHKKTTHFTLIDFNEDGVLDLFLRTTELTYVIWYDDIDEKSINFRILENPHAILLENGSLFSSFHYPSSNSTSIKIIPITISGGMYDTLLSATIRDSYSYYYCPTGETTREAWLEYFESLDLKRAYWYLFNDSNIEKYLPCESTLSFTKYDFSSYSSLLDIIYDITARYNICKLEPYYKGKLDVIFDYSTQWKREMFLSISDLVYYMYPKALGGSYPAEKAIGYAIKDLNGDGIDELMLFNGENYWLNAVFTIKNGILIRDTTDYGFENVSYSTQLEYWEKTVGIDVLPLFPDSTHFDIVDPEYDGK
jgi:hypothetical protein